MQYTMVLVIPDTPALRATMRAPASGDAPALHPRVHATHDVETGAAILLYQSRKVSLRTIDRAVRRFTDAAARALAGAPAPLGPWKAIVHLPWGGVDLAALARAEWSTPGDSTGPHVRVELDPSRTPPLACVRVKHRTAAELRVATAPVLAAIAGAADDVAYAVAILQRTLRAAGQTRRVTRDGDDVCVEAADGSVRRMRTSELLTHIRALIHHSEPRL